MAARHRVRRCQRLFGHSSRTSRFDTRFFALHICNTGDDPSSCPWPQTALRLLMERRFWIVGMLALFAFSACRKHKFSLDVMRTPVSSPPKGKRETPVDASKLLRNEDIVSVFNEPLRQAIPSTRGEAGFAISQCYFELPTASKSAVVTVTCRGTGADAKGPKDFWSQRFHPEREPEDEKEEKDGEDRVQSPPQKVENLGDEAFWLGSGFCGTLYVLHGDCFLRIAVGGENDQSSKRSLKYL